MNFSVSEENYIKGIYHLQQQSGLVNTNSLAAEMQTRPASVTDMLKKLKHKKLLQYERYKGFRLNESGKKIAIGVVRKHRLWEFFLSNKLGFEWDKVHAIAEELEHVSSDELVERLDKYLGYPAFDPHGDPIPDSSGKIPQQRQVNLLQLKPGQPAIVSAVTNQTGQMLEMLNHYGIAIGTRLELIRHFGFDGSIEIHIHTKTTCMLSEQVAKNVFVRHD